VSTYRVGLIYTDMKNNIQKLMPIYQEAAILGVPLSENTEINVRSWHRAAVAALTTLDFNRLRDL